VSGGDVIESGRKWLRGEVIGNLDETSFGRRRKFLKM
jgi:hypothetical protein